MAGNPKYDVHVHMEVFEFFPAIIHSEIVKNKTFTQIAEEMQNTNNLDAGRR